MGGKEETRAKNHEERVLERSSMYDAITKYYDRKSTGENNRSKNFKELGKLAMSEVSISEDQVYGASINQYSEVLVTQSCPTLCDPRL